MKVISLPLFSILFFCSFLFGQGEQKPECPQIVINDSADNPRKNQKVHLSVKFGEETKNFQLKYNWYVSAGIIVAGQGTSAIDMEFKEEGTSTATVEIEGLPAGCYNTASDTFRYSLGGDPAEIAEWMTSDPKLYESAINDLARLLKENPDHTLWFLVYRKKNLSRLKASRKIRQIKLAFGKKGIPAKKLIFITGEIEEDVIKIYLIPVTAVPPS